MTVKRYMLIAMSLVLASGIVLSACAAPAPEGTRTIRMGGVPAQWVDTRLAAGMILETISELTPYDTKLVGGLGIITPERFEGLMSGKIDIMTDFSGHTMLKRDLAEVIPETAEKWQYLAFAPRSYTPFVLLLRKDTPVNSAKDVIDKEYPLKFASGFGTGRLLNGWIFDAVGSPNGVDAFIEWGGTVDDQTGTRGIEALIREGMLDGFMRMGNFYYPGLEEVNVMVPLKFVPTAQSDEALRRIREKIPDIERFVMKAGMYTFVNEDVIGLQLMRFYIASPTVPEDVMYNITKAVWENREYLARASMEFGETLTLEQLNLAHGAGIPFHPGAERFFKEIGAW